MVTLSVRILDLSIFSRCPVFVVQAKAIQSLAKVLVVKSHVIEQDILIFGGVEEATYPTGWVL